MGDPLSVAASITGLLTLAAQLYTTLDTFVSNIKDAPLLSRIILSEIKSFHNSLHGLQELLNDPKFHRSTRGCLISADYVVVSFTDAVLLFSELEAIVTPLSTYAPELSFAAKAQWARKKTRLNELVGRLQWQKHTLVLQLNILKCASDVDAEHNRQVLNTLICERLAKDQDMERRLDQVEQQLLLRSVRDDATIRSGASDDSDNLTITAAHPRVRTEAGSTASTSVSSSSDIPLREFETHLNNSWVYRRNEHRDETMSFRSSVLRLSAWSVLSDMSLANISIIAVMALPVQLQELSNGYWYTRNLKDGLSEGQAFLPLMSGGLGDLDGPSDIDQLPQTLYSAQASSDAPADDTRSAMIALKEEQTSNPTRFQDETTLSALLGERDTGNRMAQVNLLDRTEVPELVETPKDTGYRAASSPAPAVSSAGDSSNDDDDDEPEYFCKGCGKVLPEGKAFELAGNRWHIDCFRCDTCATLLDSDANLLLLGDGSLICNNCSYSCEGCGKKIEDLAILTGDKAYCASCFRCWNCKRKIENLRYARTAVGIYCISCHETLVARKQKREDAKRLQERD